MAQWWPLDASLPVTCLHDPTPSGPADLPNLMLSQFLLQRVKLVWDGEVRVPGRAHLLGMIMFWAWSPCGQGTLLGEPWSGGNKLAPAKGCGLGVGVGSRSGEREIHVDSALHLFLLFSAFGRASASLTALSQLLLRKLTQEQCPELG